jgi:hypothetical protein
MTLRQWLKRGKMVHDGGGKHLSGGQSIARVVDDIIGGGFTYTNLFTGQQDVWFVDVLEDGTAITYCADR